MKWKGIAVGQVLAALYLGTGVFSELLLGIGVATPVFQNVWVYFTLMLLYSGKICYRVKRGNMRIHWKEGWKYLLASLTDSQSNFLVILSYQFTSLTSVFILGNSSVLMVCILSVLFLKRRYRKWEWTGVLLALIGIILAILASLVQENWKFQGSVLGNCLVLLGTFLYAVTNVWAEYLFLHEADGDEYLVGLGIGGCLLSLAESLSLEMSQIAAAPVSSVGLYSGYTLCLAGMYTICPYYFKYFSAVMYNLSLLTTVGYGLVVSVLLFKQQLQWLDVVAYFFVILGLVCYSYQPQSKVSLLQENSETMQIQTTS